MFENKTQHPIRKLPSKRMSEIPFIKKMNSGRIRSRADGIVELIGRFLEFGRSDRAEFLVGGRYGNSAVDEWLDLPKDLRAGLWRPRPKLVQIPFRFDRALVYHRLSEIPPSELDEILHGCSRRNFALFH